MSEKLLSPDQITDAVIKIGIKKAVKENKIQLLLLGFLAGAFIALGAYTSNLVIHDMSGSYGVLKFVQGAIFPVGLILVLVAGAELFTGNSLILVSLLEKEITFSDMLKNWSLVYFGNFIGSLFFAWLIYGSGLLNISGGELGTLHIKIAHSKATLPFVQAFIRGILANFAVCLAVWMAIGAKDMIGKVFAIWFPVMAFVAGGFEHSIANMYYIPAGILAKKEFAELSVLSSEQLIDLNWIGFLNNLVPVTLGNLVGGVIFVGVFYWLIFKRFSNK